MAIVLEVCTLSRARWKHVGQSRGTPCTPGAPTAALPRLLARPAAAPTPPNVSADLGSTTVRGWAIPFGARDPRDYGRRKDQNDGG